MTTNPDSSMSNAAGSDAGAELVAAAPSPPTCCGGPMRPTSIGGWLCNGGSDAMDGKGCDRHQAPNGTRSSGPWWKETTAERAARSAAPPVAGRQVPLVDAQQRLIGTAEIAGDRVTARVTDPAAAAAVRTAIAAGQGPVSIGGRVASAASELTPADLGARDRRWCDAGSGRGVVRRPVAL